MTWDAAVRFRAAPPALSDSTKKGRHWGCDLAELGEDQQLLLLCRDDLRDLAQACQLSAVTLSPRAIAKPVRWVIADLLEAHQACQHHAFALDPVGRIQLGRQLGDAS